MTCIHCGDKMQRYSPCGGAICEKCCDICYKSDDGCEDHDSPDKLRGEIFKTHEEGKSIRTLASTFNLSESTVRTYLKEYRCKKK